MNFVNPPYFPLAIAALELALSFGALPLIASESKVAYSQDLDVRLGYVGGANLHEHSVDFGSIDEQNSSVRYIVCPQITRRVLLRFGLEWDRFSFDVPSGTPAPNTLQQVSALFGLDWQMNDNWLLRGEVHPGLYSDFHDVGFKDVDAPILLSAAYLSNADLQWFFGFRIDARSRYPVIPAVGVRWKFADDWTLKAILPEPRIEYELSRNDSV